MRRATLTLLALCQAALFAGCTDSTDSPTATSAGVSPAADRLGSAPLLRRLVPWD
jgi:hypothetical protein